jgi:hypothetical protein
VTAIFHTLYYSILKNNYNQSNEKIFNEWYDSCCSYLSNWNNLIIVMDGENPIDKLLHIGKIRTKTREKSILKLAMLNDINDTGYVNNDNILSIINKSFLLDTINILSLSNEVENEYYTHIKNGTYQELIKRVNISSKTPTKTELSKLSSLLVKKGYIIITANGEGERLCGSFAKEKIVDYVLSIDTDVITHGTPFSLSTNTNTINING